MVRTVRLLRFLRYLHVYGGAYGGPFEGARRLRELQNEFFEDGVNVREHCFCVKV